MKTGSLHIWEGLDNNRKNLSLFRYLDVEAHFELKRYLLGDFEIFMGTLPVSYYRRADAGGKNRCEVMWRGFSGWRYCLNDFALICPRCGWKVCEEDKNDHGCV